MLSGVSGLRAPSLVVQGKEQGKLKNSKACHRKI